ncbi:hypothetical protein PILCRDRAFT_795798 [Piloderma croceum F 1598]|uniref:Uncharacterized protein n=1 Tax=Piloderma croceum (strain F 1598) TaxID=765440 RepID=A0A0C3FC98_PILCF|nr:hypothetical protein PILCRDRAFT_795798 [Piloderma croceum F 1598]
MWDTTTDSDVFGALRGPEGNVTCVAFTSDGQRLLSSASGNAIYDWDLSTGMMALVLQGHNDNVRSISISSNGNCVASGSTDGTIKLWNIGTGEECHDQINISALSFSPDGQLFASISTNDCRIRLWNAATGQEACLPLQNHQDTVECVAFSPDGQLVASGSADTTIIVWDVISGKEVLVLRGHEGKVISVAFSWDGMQILSGSIDDTVRLWSLKTGAEARFPMPCEATQKFGLLLFTQTDIWMSTADRLHLEVRFGYPHI